MYVRGGSILPLQPLVQNTGRDSRGSAGTARVSRVGLHGSLYLDDGHTFRYQQGEYLRQTLTCKSDGKSVSANFGARQVSFTPWRKMLEIVIYDTGLRASMPRRRFRAARIR